MTRPEPALWCVRCPSCGEEWPATAFRVLRLFTVRRCQVCRKAGPKFARFVHYIVWPFGIPRPTPGAGE